MLIDTALQVLASQESMLASAIAHRSRPSPSAALELLSPRAKPLGHWLRQVCVAAGCRSLGELEALLLRKGARLRNRRISLDTLKAWSSMRPGMLMTSAGRMAVLTVVQDEAQRGGLGVRFALARFLAFLCDLLRSSMEGESVMWAQAQQIVADRYRSCLEGSV